jgi:hypothetical protein
MNSKLATVALSVLGLSASVNAGVLWDNMFDLNANPQPAPPPYFTSSSYLPAVLEDATLVGAGPYTLTGFDLGYVNNAASIGSFDLLVQFYDTVNYAANPSNINPIGGLLRYTINYTVVNGEADTTGLLSLPSLLVPDGTLGVSVRAVQVGGNADATNITFLFKDIPLVVGSSNELFSIDDNTTNGVFEGSNEIATWRDDNAGFPAANLFARIEGTLVPEPGTLALLGLGGLTLLRRRR